MALNPFHYHSRGVTGPAMGSFAITPADGTDLSTDVRAVTIGTAGTLSWVGIDGTTYTTASLPAGTYPLTARRIRATGTTAAQITGWI